MKSLNEHAISLIPNKPVLNEDWFEDNDFQLGTVTSEEAAVIDSEGSNNLTVSATLTDLQKQVLDTMQLINASIQTLVNVDKAELIPVLQELLDSSRESQELIQTELDKLNDEAESQYPLDEALEDKPEKFWFGKYTDTNKEIHKVYFKDNAFDFEAAEKEFEEIIPEPFTSAKLSGSANSEKSLINDGFSRINECLNEEWSNNKEANDLGRELEQEFNANHVNGEFLYAQDYPLNSTCLKFNVYGDWKHDHWAAKDIITDKLLEKGKILLKIDSQEIGQSEDDSYEAEYDVFYVDNEEDLNRWNSMRGLFTESKSLRESNEPITYRVSGRRYSDEPSYYSWDDEKKYKWFEEIPNSAQAFDLSQEDVHSLDDAVNWMINNHPELYMGMSAQNNKGDFYLGAVPCGEYPEGTYENEDARIKYAKTQLRKPRMNESMMHESTGNDFLDDFIKQKVASIINGYIDKGYDNFDDIRYSLLKEIDDYLDALATHASGLAYQDSLDIKTSDLAEDSSSNITVGIYGDDVPGISSVDQLVNYFQKKGIQVSEVDGNMDYGWEMNLTGPARNLFFAVVNKIPGYNSDSVEDFIDQYSIEENLTEDTVKQNGKWVNKGKEGTHGTFKTKKAADAQRKAMFAQGYKAEELNEDIDWDKIEEFQSACFDVMQKFGGDLDDFNVREVTRPDMVPAIEVSFKSSTEDIKSKKDIEKIRKALSDKFSELGYDLDPYDDYYMNVEAATEKVPYGTQPVVNVWFRAFDSNWEDDTFFESKSNSKLTEKLSLNDAWNALTEDM